MNQPLAVFRDADIFPEGFKYKENWNRPTERDAVRSIVFDADKKIALAGTLFRLLPGGGVDEGETLEEAAARECLEEVGCKVEVGEYLGFLEEYRDNGKRHQITHCFVAHVVGEKDKPQTSQEDELGMEAEWFEFDEAVERIKKQIETIPFERYNACFNVRLSHVFLLEYKKKHA